MRHVITLLMLVVGGCLAGCEDAIRQKNTLQILQEGKAQGHLVVTGDGALKVGMRQEFFGGADGTTISFDGNVDFADSVRHTTELLSPPPGAPVRPEPLEGAPGFLELAEGASAFMPSAGASSVSVAPAATVSEWLECRREMPNVICDLLAKSDGAVDFSVQALGALLPGSLVRVESPQRFTRIRLNRPAIDGMFSAPATGPFPQIGSTPIVLATYTYADEGTDTLPILTEVRAAPPYDWYWINPVVRQPQWKYAEVEFLPSEWKP